MIKTGKLLAALALSHLAGIIGSIFTTPAISAWYAGLVKPVFSPPNWIFAPVWLSLYTLMGISLYLIWTSKKSSKLIATTSFTFYLQLILNTSWSVIFFGLRQPGWALANILILLLIILVLIVESHKLNRNAAWLLIPYFLWVAFASTLNLAIVILN